MMKLSRLLLDTNVWLDYFMNDGPHIDAIERIIAEGLSERILLLYAPTSAKDLFYLLPRRLRAKDGENETSAASRRSAAWTCVERMMDIGAAAPLSQAECELARMMRPSFDDLEDNLVIAAAETAGADYVITSDRRLLAAAPEACITPERAIDLLGISRTGAFAR